MKSIRQCVGSVVLGTLCTVAGAQYHQVCYEGPTQSVNGTVYPTGVYGCAMDVPGYCTISSQSSGMTPVTAYPPDIAVAGSFLQYRYTSVAGSFTAKFTFFDSNNTAVAERFCTVNAVGVHGNWPGRATPGAVLTGFTTDASGLAMTAIWRLQRGADASWARVPVQAPADFVAVGGGAMGVQWNNGALVTSSQRGEMFVGDQRTWLGATTQASNAAQPHRTTAWVIGLRIHGLAPRDLAPLIQVAGADSGPTSLANAAAAAGITLGTVLVGGSAHARSTGAVPPFNQLGQLLTASAPTFRRLLDCSVGFRCRILGIETAGWRAESKDHVIADPGFVNAQTFSLPATISVGGRSFSVLNRVVSATSAEVAHPTIDVGGLRGEFALTGIGAFVNWRRFDTLGNQLAAGNLLWRLEPRADLGGATVASKDHVVPSPATITAHAIGIKLVPQ